MTCEEIELAIREKHQSVAGNLRHLKVAGHVVETEDKRPNNSGRLAQVLVTRNHVEEIKPAAQGRLF